MFSSQRTSHALTVSASAVVLSLAISQPSFGADWRKVYSTIRSQNSQMSLRQTQRARTQRPRSTKQNSRMQNDVLAAISQRYKNHERTRRVVSGLYGGNKSASAMGRQVLKRGSRYRDAKGNKTLAKPAETTVMPLPTQNGRNRQSGSSSVSGHKVLVRNPHRDPNGVLKLAEPAETTVMALPTTKESRNRQSGSSSVSGHKVLVRNPHRDPNGVLKLAEPAETTVMALPTAEPVTVMPLTDDVPVVMNPDAKKKQKGKKKSRNQKKKKK